MKTKRPWAKLGLITAAAVALSSAVIMTACGKLKSDGVPSSSEQSLTLDVVNASQGADGRYSVRANGKDTIEIVATVKGLSSFVGFYIPATWGSFIGGTPNPTDGFTYYSANSEGKARATLVAGVTAPDAPTTTTPTNSSPTGVSNPTGRIELVARSLTAEKVLPLSFDYAGLALFPSTLSITDWSAPGVYIWARGGLPPIEWFVSHPRVLKYNVINDTTIMVYVSDATAITTAATNVIVTARDAEGQTASATVVLGGNVCMASTITAEPATPKTSTAVGATTISVVVVDTSQVEAASVKVIVGGDGSGTITLTQWDTPGVFQGSYSIPALTIAGKTYNFTYTGVDAACAPAVVKDTVTTS